VSRVGRPKEHNEQTAAALLDAAERIVEAGGVESLSLRAVANEVGTSTRAVYSTFGSKEGLVVALGSLAFTMLGAAIRELPTTDDPAADLVEAGVDVFRAFSINHTALFRIGFQSGTRSSAPGTQFQQDAMLALAGLEARVARLDPSNGLGGRSTRQASAEFHALCEGLAVVELRGNLPPGQEEQIWRSALWALVTGFAAPPRSTLEISQSPRIAT
jgi:AcrR family transcriptional regulator